MSTPRIPIHCDTLFDQHLPQWEALRDADEDGMSFHVLRAGTPEDDGRPLLVWVHPGDACESDSPSARIRSRSLELQQRMAHEVMEKLESHRVIVLHRQSSVFAFEPWSDHVDPDYADAMGACLNDPRVTLVWGDDLHAASQWILDQEGLGTEAFLTGAWRHPEWGCVTAVGQRLQAGGLRVAVSEHSPSEPGIVRVGWKPAQSAAANRRTPRP